MDDQDAGKERPAESGAAAPGRVGRIPKGLLRQISSTSSASRYRAGSTKPSTERACLSKMWW